MTLTVEQLAALLREGLSQEAGRIAGPPPMDWLAAWLLPRLGSGVAPSHMGRVQGDKCDFHGPCLACGEPSAAAIEAALTAKYESLSDPNCAGDHDTALAMLRAAYAVDAVSPRAPEGPWAEGCGPSMADSAPWRVQRIENGKVRNISLESEAEALAVRDALNRVSQEGK